MTENIYQHHCPYCRCRRQNEDIVYSPINHQVIFLDKDERICNKCGVKQNKMLMDEFANGKVICWQQIFCEQRQKGKF